MSWSPGVVLDPPLGDGLDTKSSRPWNIIHCMPCKTPCRFAYPFKLGHWGPQALVQCEVGRSRHFPQMMGPQAQVWSDLKKELEGWDSYITSPHEPFIHAAICTITDRLQLLKILARSSCCTHTRRPRELVYMCRIWFYLRRPSDVYVKYILV
jgi:hypothetical protein